MLARLVLSQVEPLFYFFSLSRPSVPACSHTRPDAPTERKHFNSFPPHSPHPEANFTLSHPCWPGWFCPRLSPFFTFSPFLALLFLPVLTHGLTLRLNESISTLFPLIAHTLKLISLSVTHAG